MDLPAGTIIRGVPREAQMILLPGKKKKATGGAGRN
jgi:hypothetical protein